MLNIDINTESAKTLNLLTLPGRKRRQILRGAGRKVRRDSKARLKAQKGINGQAWEGRSNGRKAKMLKKLGKHLQVHTNENRANITFASPRVAKVARAHQDGEKLTHTAPKGQPDYQGPATTKQAKALIKAGYTIRKKRGKGWKTPSLKWIKENLKLGQAGLILRILKEQEKGQQQWDIQLPSRSFLGQNQNEYKQLKNYMFDQATRH
ncbi:phage virion morphogenesis protein [Shewanella surugensis]|uniref:Phage virion morphogenesis protein n=1 Tax=Shewanella surugensis TaxID=212020 RepID=A0ABT0L802_9GAMM|nr:phage virion morphogenesis protein [Shewanella surugensis]MCL1123306.1 phage virion morphogenesis protein [Shewanella surugensis]